MLPIKWAPITPDLSHLCLPVSAYLSLVFSPRGTLRHQPAKSTSRCIYPITSVGTRIRTMVVAAITRSTNYYTITAMQPSTTSSPYSAFPTVSSATGRGQGRVCVCVCGGVLCSKRLGFQPSIKSHLRKAGLLPLASQETIYLTTQPKHMPSNIFSKAPQRRLWLSCQPPAYLD